MKKQNNKHETQTTHRPETESIIPEEAPRGVTDKGKIIKEVMESR